jgi:hypothetical protein
VACGITDVAGGNRNEGRDLNGTSATPEICRFPGISICMYHRDHAPPHFHAEYGEHEITVEIQSGVVEGRFPRRAPGLVMEWYTLRKEELLENWQLAAQQLPLNDIRPLE